MSNEKLKLNKDYDFGCSIALFTTKYSTWFIPLSISVTLVPFCISVYLSAVLLKQVPAFVPFLSECITRHPQAGYSTLYTCWLSLICKFNY